MLSGCDDIALQVNAGIEKVFAGIGLVVGRYPYWVLSTVCIVLGACCIGFATITIEDDIFELWTPTDSPVVKEKKFVDKYWKESDTGLLIISGYAKAGTDTNILSEEYIREWHETHLYIIANQPKKNYTYEKTDSSQAVITFSLFPENFEEPKELTTLSYLASLGMGPTAYASEVVPLCRHFSQSPAEAQFEMHCYFVGVLDCFTEGGHLFPYENYLQKTYFASVAPANPYTYRDSFANKSTEELGAALGPSCQLFEGTVIPFNMIMGGESRTNASDSKSALTGLKSVQSLGYLDSATSIARKLKIAKGECTYTATYGVSCDTITQAEMDEAQEILDEWQLDWIDFMKEYAAILQADDSKLFNIVFWTSRTPGDILADASSASFGLIGAAYAVMIIFAALAALNLSNGFLSRSEVSAMGVLLVLLSVAASIGLGSLMNITLSPNVIQVLPFIALGFGVDDMFVLLFSFRYREGLKIEEMIAETTRIAGSSVALTSLANLVGFSIGTTMVLPDVARFASYGAIVVVLNFVAILFGFTSLLTLTARRMQHGYKDWSFLCCFSQVSKAKAVDIKFEKVAAEETTGLDGCFRFLSSTPVRIALLGCFAVLICVGSYGCTLIEPGLPLADIVPTDTYGSDFLRIREMFYFAYPVSLYTDAQDDELKPIDWPNKFELYVSRTEDIYSINENVLENPDVHSFWQWYMRSYLQRTYADSLTMQYALGTPFDISAALSDSTAYQAYQCDTDVELYCKSITRDYAYNSDLYNCLLLQYQLDTLTSSDCKEWVQKVLYANLAVIDIARQIEITSLEANADALGVNGLYVRPSNSDIKVYLKYPNYDGVIYQDDCALDYCAWYLLDSAFNIVYVGDTTSVENSEAPAQGGWKNINGDTVQVTHVYYDFYVSYMQVIRSNVFLSTDVTAQTRFSFSHLYEAQVDSSTAACTQWKVMRLLMANSDAFTYIAINSTKGGQSQVTCDAVLESTEMCLSIRDETDFGAVTCGVRESAANNNLWYLGNATDGLYQITSSAYTGNDTNTFISEATFDHCTDPTQFENFTSLSYNFFKPCGDDSNFGGFGISKDNASTHNFCNTQSQQIRLRCDAASDCTDLKVCYNDYERLIQNVSIAAQDCNTQNLTYFDTQYNAGANASVLAPIVDQCYLRHFNKLSACCQTAVQSSILSLSEYTCATIESFFNVTADSSQSDDVKSVCESKPRCAFDNSAFTCTQVATGSTFDDCAALIAEQCTPSSLSLTTVMLRRGAQSSFVNCINTSVATHDGSDACQSTFNTEVATYGACLYPVSSYWNFTTTAYDYAICSDAEIAAITSQPCGSTNSANDSQLTCLLTNVDGLPDGCCKRAVQQIASNTYAYSRECEADVDAYCAPSLSAFLIDPSAGSMLIAALTEFYFLNPFNTSQKIYPGTICMTQMLTALQLGTLSPKCTLAITHCEAIDVWPVTTGGSLASVACGQGNVGNQTRECWSNSSIAMWSPTIDVSQCVPLTCAAVTEYDQSWPETAVDTVRTIQGGLINNLTNNAHIATQISTALIAQFGAHLTCDPLQSHNIYYARRQCTLNPYNTSQAIWSDPVLECRPLIYAWNNVQNETVCDFLTEEVTAGLAAQLDAALAFVNPALIGILQSTKKANLIDAIVWSIYDESFNDGVTTTPAQHIALSQSYCEQALTKCAAFSYDDTFGISYFFDYCPLLTQAEMSAGNLPEIENSVAAVSGVLTSLAQGIHPSLDGTIFYPWSFYDDPIYAALAPLVSNPKLSSFAARHTTYIAPLSMVEYVPTHCSIRSIQSVVASGDATQFIAPQHAWNADGIPHAQCFNNTLWLYFIDPAGGVLNRDKVIFTDESKVSDLLGFDGVQIKSSTNTIMVRGVNNDVVAVEFILDLRKRIDEQWAQQDELYVVPGGLIINLFSQYIGVSSYLITNLLLVSIAIVLCGLMFLLNPIAVLVCLVCNSAMIVEVYGFAHWIGLRLNGVLVLNIVIAVAFTMEFTAHVGRAFVLSDADKESTLDAGQQRMIRTLREMFTPVSLGAVTTFLGVVPIAFAQFPYFRQYYFSLYVIIVVFGWLNGVLFQTAILSFLQPKPLHPQTGEESTLVKVNSKSQLDSEKAQLAPTANVDADVEMEQQSAKFKSIGLKQNA